MATKRPRSEDSYNDVMICPVCTNEFKDPRLLSCGHHFCLGCLEKIAQGQEDGSIPCPTCRHITREKTEDLKKLKLNEFQDKVSLFLSQKRAKVDKTCGLCKTSTPATYVCRDCPVNMCGECKEKHKDLEKIAGHKISSLSEKQFCLEHPDNFVQCVCKTCDKFLCQACFVQHDKSHRISDVKKAAEKAKERLKKIVLNEDSLKMDKYISQYIADALTNLQGRNKAINKIIEESERILYGLLDELKSYKIHNDEICQMEIKELEIQDRDAKDFIKTKEKLIRHVAELLESASECEIISREKEFPKYASDNVRSVLTKLSVQLPSLWDLKELTDVIQSLQTGLHFGSDCVPIIKEEEPLHPMEVQGKFQCVAGEVHSLAYDSNNDTYVVRCSDPEKFIQVFDTSGKIITTIGSQENDIDTSGGIDIDTKRKLYLLPTADGKIFTIDYEGKEENVIDVSRFRLVGISYCQVPNSSSDRYIVSSAHHTEDEQEASHAVYVVDPVNKNVLQEIKEPHCSQPYAITSFCVNSDIQILVGYYSGGMEVFYLKGDIIESTEGWSGKKVDNIVGVCSGMNQGLGILGCEDSQNTILSYGYNKDERTFADAKILFRMEDIAEEEPNIEEIFTMAYDWKRRRIFLTFAGPGSSIFVLKEKILK